jgi:hypothetical protein
MTNGVEDERAGVINKDLILWITILQLKRNAGEDKQ